MFGLDQNFIGTQDGISGPVKRNQIEKGITNTPVIIVGYKIIRQLFKSDPDLIFYLNLYIVKYLDNLT